MTTPEDGSGRIPMATVNEMSAGEFVARFSGLCGGSWIAYRLAAQRPLGTVRGLMSAMMTILHDAPEEDQQALLNSFPEHGDQPEGESLDRQRALYQERFGYPFIVAVKGRCAKSSVETALLHRLESFDELDHLAKRRFALRFDPRKTVHLRFGYDLSAADECGRRLIITAIATL